MNLKISKIGTEKKSMIKTENKPRIEAICIDKTCTDAFAFDAGFGYSKFCGKLSGAVASIIEPIDSLEEISGVDSKESIIEELVIEHDGKLKLVGVIAAQHNRRISRNTQRNRISDDSFEILFKAAIVAAYSEYGHVSMTLTTGLPNNDFMAQKDELKKKIESIREVCYFHNGKKYVINVNYESIHVIRQPDGFKMQLCVDENFGYSPLVIENDDGEDEAIHKFAVIDFGQATINIAVYDKGNLIGNGYSIDGMYLLYDQIDAALRRNFSNLEPSHLEVERAILGGVISIRGERTSVKDIVEPVLDQFVEDRHKSIFEKLKGELDSLQAIFLIGGSTTSIEGEEGGIVSERLTNLFSDINSYQKMYRVDEPQLVNVRGFHKYSCMIQSNKEKTDVAEEQEVKPKKSKKVE